MLFISDEKAFNWTKVELKLNKDKSLWQRKPSFNWTKVELKQ